MPRIAILIVSFNTADRLLETLERIPPAVMDRVEEVVVFDDCSRDHSYQAALSYKHRQGMEKIEVFRNPHYRGYGGNQKRGFQYVLRRGFDFVVVLHGDGRYAPEKLAELLAPLEAGQVDMVLGSRWMPGFRPRTGVPLYKYVANRFLSSAQRLLTGIRLSEFHSGFRAYRVDALASLPLVRNSDFWLFDTQVLLEHHAYGFRIREVPIPPFSGDEISLANGFLYAAGCLWESAKFRLAQWRLLYSSRFAPPESDYHFHDFRGSSHRLILDDLSASPPLRILDVGTAGGYLDAELQARGHTVVGIECHPERAQRARRSCSELIFGDVQSLDLSRFAESFDCAILADVLEHLAFPNVALRKVVATLKPGGRLLVCVPNIANLYVRLNLLFGRFRYETCGVLDATHLRFFTLRTFRDMVEEAGLEIHSIQPTTMPLPWLFSGVRQHRWLRLLHRALGAVTQVFRRTFAYQFLAVAEKPAWLAVSERTGAARGAAK